MVSGKDSFIWYPSDICCFNTPYRRSSYGLRSGSEVFQQRIKEIFESLDGFEICIDDFIVWGSYKQEHDLS